MAKVLTLICRVSWTPYPYRQESFSESMSYQVKNAVDGCWGPIAVIINPNCLRSNYAHKVLVGENLPLFQ